MNGSINKTEILDQERLQVFIKYPSKDNKFKIFFEKVNEYTNEKYFNYCHFRLSIFTLGHIVCTPFALRHQ